MTVRNRVPVITRILFEEDPVGIGMSLAATGDADVDEYSLEAETIVRRLGPGLDAGDVQDVVHEEFTAWFGPETAGGRERYGRVARRIVAAS